MIETYTRDGKTFTKIENLREWERNPRAIKEDDFNRLKVQLKELGQYKPLLVMHDGTVLGGNMRLKAYKSMEVIEVWVSIVNPADEKEKLKYALSDNDNVGYYVEDKLLAVIKEVGFVQQDFEMFKIDMSMPIPMDALINKEATEAKNEEINIAEIEKKFNCKCPKCDFEFNFEFKKENA